MVIERLDSLDSWVGGLARLDLHEGSVRHPGFSGQRLKLLVGAGRNLFLDEIENVHV